MRVRAVVRMVGVMAVSVALAGPAMAQTPGVRTPVEHQQVIATNPIGDILGWYNLEYNRKLSETASLEIAASTFDFWSDDLRVAKASVGARYYPQGAALTGFFVGGKLGILHYEHERWFDDEADSLMSLGAEVGYEWLIGRRRDFHVGIGAGGTRLFDGDLDGSVAYPTGRLKIGFAW